MAAGILASRLVGLVRQKVFAHVLGSGLEAAAFSAATRIPNVLQNLLGEGVLSASFIPVYAGLRAEGKNEEADRVAGAVFGLLAVVVGVLVAAGLFGSEALVELVAPGYQGEARALTIRLVRLIFPGTGVLVLSAWCLGILNSHRRFFLSYAAPVMWNLCIIAALGWTWWRHDPAATVAVWAAFGTIAGSVAQFVVQLPNVMRLLGSFRPAPSLELSSVRKVLTGFVPAVAARGVVQLSAWVDTAYATLLTERAVATLTYAQTIALLPVSLFGMSISAAELPEMSEDAVKSHEERSAALRQRLLAGLERLAFFVVPSAVAFLVLGDAISGALLESGRFTAADSRLVWYILIGSGVAVSAQTSGRLYSSAFYALKDTRTPLKFAIIRVGLGTLIGYWAVRMLPGELGLPAELGVVSITITTGAMAWLEMTLLRRALTKEIGALPSLAPRLARLWGAAVLGAGAEVALKLALVSWRGANPIAAGEWGGGFLPAPALPVLPVSVALIGVYGVTYLLVTYAMGIPQSRALLGRVLKRVGLG